MINKIDSAITPALSRLARLAAVLAIAATAAVASDSPVGSAEAPASSSSGSSFATAGGDPFAMGEKVLFVGLGLGGIGVAGSSLIPPLTAGFDFAFHPYMTLGGVFAYSRYDYGYSIYNGSLTYLTLAARGTFHPTFWFQRVRVPLDVYGVATVGYNYAIWSGHGTVDQSNLVIGPSVGARYWFNPKISGYAESGLGFGVSPFSVGLAFKM